jgi:two-component system, NtrC family, sensor kinase
MPDNSEIPLSWACDLYRIVQELATGGKPAEVPQRLLAHIVEGFEADTGCLALVGRKSGSLSIVAVVGLPKEALGNTIKIGEGIMGEVAARGEQQLLNGDLTGSKRTERDGRASRRPHSAICWPLTGERGVFGVITVNRMEDKSAFGEEDVERGRPMVALMALSIENARLHHEQRARIRMLSDLNGKLTRARDDLMQAQRMASVGQLAAGVAHEVNNPLGYVYSNLESLGRYVEGLLGLLGVYEASESTLPAESEAIARIGSLKRELDMEYLKGDITELLSESREGLKRVREIVQDLRDFADAGEQDWCATDLNREMGRILKIVGKEIGSRATIAETFGTLPQVDCMPAQIGQVFVALLMNAAQAVSGATPAKIVVKTGAESGSVWVSVQDAGVGIPKENMSRIFDPFFTTWPVGTGKGLGLTLAYGIVEKHGGRIDVRSEPGRGSAFRVWLPLKQVGKDAPEAPAPPPATQSAA